LWTRALTDAGRRHLLVLPNASETGGAPVAEDAEPGEALVLDEAALRSRDDQAVGERVGQALPRLHCWKIEDREIIVFVG
jgi:hypothetical protein